MSAIKSNGSEGGEGEGFDESFNRASSASSSHEKQRGTGPWLPANEVDGRFPLTSGSNLECKEFRTTKGDHRRSAEWNPLWPLRSSIEERQRQEDWRLISVHSTQVSTTHYNNLTGLDLPKIPWILAQRRFSSSPRLLYKQRYFDLKKNNGRCVDACKYIVKQGNTWRIYPLEINKKKTVVN